MAATLRQLNTPRAELLRVAESGDVDALLRLLPRVDDVNARNRHGMTALMKAAFYGHEPVVRALLEHGADPNLTRHDRFTALALAAFFGHGETVKTLIQYGAKTEAVTRAGASALTWAKVRTFDEVARCLETHAPKPVRATPTPVRHPPTPAACTPVEVKTLTDPPEIWDLVQEVPRSFDPRSAFVSRITSMNRTFVLGACVVVLLIVAGGVGVLVLRNSQMRGSPTEIPPVAVAAETTVSTPPLVQTVVESPPAEVVNDNHSRTVPNKARLAIRQPRTFPVVTEAPAEIVESREAPAVATPQFELPKPAPPVVKTNASAPPKSAPPPKGKVIQWP